MTEISYANAPVPVREDLTAAHRRAWRRLAQAGNWWIGADRVAIAAEVRHARQCTLCAIRKTALSPYTIAGTHDRVSALPATAIDVIHRVTTDPRRLTKAWFESIMATKEITDAQYVEILGDVVAVVCIDSFCWGLGVPVHPLPYPQAGEPSHYRLTSARPEAAWVPMIPADGATGEEVDLWHFGRTANVFRALSLVPDAVRQLVELNTAHYVAMDNFMDLTWGRSLSRAQMELIAGRVSALRECFY